MEDQIDFTDHRYSRARAKINDMLAHGLPWDEIFLAGKKDANDLEAYLQDEFFGDVSPSDWNQLVLLQKENAEKSKEVDFGPSIFPRDNDNHLPIPSQRSSLWFDYKQKLIKAGFNADDIGDIQLSAWKTLNHLTYTSEKHKPTKGVIVGNVQSGKTANMTALIAMASDYGWNVFIILSGIIDNLRKQTYDRLTEDLHSNVSRVRVESIIDLDNNPSSCLHLLPTDVDRYVLVCLKNGTRLKQLLTWLNKDANKKSQMRVLIIDDEADQASLNTQKIDKEAKTAINRLITDLVYDYNDVKKKPIEPDSFYTSVNYVGYTATPYGNFLNEGPSIRGHMTLFPEDFIGVMRNSKLYFGPQQIFGGNGINRLKVVNHIGEDDSDQLKAIVDGTAFKLPQGIRDALFWFYCCLATFRFWKMNKPVSMLINISQSVDSHENVIFCLKTFLHGLSEEDLLNNCEKVYRSQTEAFTKENFLFVYSDYAGEDVRDYPDFEEIKPFISEAFRSGFSLVNKDQVTKRRIYTRGVHYFIDNGRYTNSNNTLADYRVEYPTKEDALDFATGFIVVGGQTLSRGLTIEGLVSTYFARGSKQGDTLMQMGRWFGYRKGYELLPRIWMTQENDDRFVYLSRIDLELKQYIHDFSEDDQKMPKDYGIRVLNSPFPNWMSLTMKRKMQGCIVARKDFSDNKFQTTKFFPDAARLKENITTTGEFVDKTLSNCRYLKVENRYVWWGVSWKAIINYLSNLNFPSTDCDYLDVAQFKQWLEKVYEKKQLDDWEVVFSGPNKTAGSDLKPVGSINVAMVNRARNGMDDRPDGLIDVRVLRDNRDMYVDIPLKKRQELGFNENDATQLEISQLRSRCGLNRIPQLIIYLIDKFSKPIKSGTNSRDLQAAENVIGIALNIPTGDVKKDYSEELIIDLSKYKEEQENK